jgi:hypothetical protein
VKNALTIKMDRKGFAMYLASEGKVWEGRHEGCVLPVLREIIAPRTLEIPVRAYRVQLGV